MARRRGFRGLGNIMNQKVDATDVLIGGAAAALGIGIAKFVEGKIWDGLPGADGKANTTPEMVTKLMPLLGAGAVGVLSYFVLPKVSPKLGARKVGLTVGAAAAGVLPVIYPWLSKTFTKTVDGKEVSYFPPFSGFIVDAPRFRSVGVIENRPALSGRSASLAMSAMEPEDIEESLYG